GAAIEWPGPGGSPAESSSNWAPFFGRPLSWTSDEITDFGSVRGVLKAAGAIATGQCEVVVWEAGRAADTLWAAPPWGPPTSSSLRTPTAYSIHPSSPSWRPGTCT